MQHSILKIHDVMSTTKKGRSAIYKEIKEGNFPPPIRLGARSVGWTAESVNRWIEARIAASQVYSQ